MIGSMLLRKSEVKRCFIVLFRKFSARQSFSARRVSFRVYGSRLVCTDRHIAMKLCGCDRITRAQQLLRWATVWPQETWAEKWRAAVPLSVGELGPHLT